MALIAMNGFDKYVNAADLQTDALWYIFSTSGVTFPAGRYDGQAIRSTGVSNSLGLTLPQGTTSTYFFGFAIKPESYPGGQTLFYAYSVGGDVELEVELNSNGTMTFKRGGVTTLGTTTALNTNEWNYVVVKEYLANSGGTLEVWVNGVKDINNTSADTLDTQASISYMKFYFNNAADWSFDDIYIGDTSGSDMTDQVGDCHIELLDPDGNGTTNNFTASPAVSQYLNVDDSNSSDGDTTYNYSATATDKELYTFSAIQSTVNTVYGVQVSARVRKEDAGNREIKTVARSSATEVDGNSKGMATYYGWTGHIYENDPNGGGNWTESAVNAAEFGIKITV